MRDGVPADPRTIRELLQAIQAEVVRFSRFPLEEPVFNHAEAALAQLDAAERNIYFQHPHARGECRLVPDPDSGVVLDPQHNDTP